MALCRARACTCDVQKRLQATHWRCASSVAPTQSSSSYPQIWTPDSPRPNYAPEGLAVDAEDARRLTGLVQSAKGNLVAITGAGFSTESGVPDYRSPQGSYSKGHVPMKHQEFVQSRTNRARYWARSLQGWRFFDGARPNLAHRALAAMERERVVSGVITQNVDGLHQKAGSLNVLDLHGRNNEVECLTCHRRRPRNSYQEELEECNSEWIQIHMRKDARPADIRADGDAHLDVNDFATFTVPPCSACGGIWKPRVVFFGGSLEAEVRSNAMQMVLDSDGVIALGTSLQVYSAFRLIKAAVDGGKPVALVNIGATRADPLVPAQLRWSWRCSEALTAVCDRLHVQISDP